MSDIMSDPYLAPLQWNRLAGARVVFETFVFFNSGSLTRTVVSEQWLFKAITAAAGAPARGRKCVSTCGERFM